MAVLLDLFLEVNSKTGEFFGIGMVVSLYFIILLYTLVNRGVDSTPDAFIAAGVVTGMASIFLYLMGMISGFVFGTTVALIAISLILAAFNKSD